MVKENTIFPLVSSMSVADLGQGQLDMRFPANGRHAIEYCMTFHTGLLAWLRAELVKYSRSERRAKNGF